MLETFPIPLYQRSKGTSFFLSPPKIFTEEQQVKPVKKTPTQTTYPRIGTILEGI
jgi:hypothetical protein